MEFSKLLRGLKRKISCPFCGGKRSVYVAGKCPRCGFNLLCPICARPFEFDWGMTRVANMFVRGKTLQCRDCDLYIGIDSYRGTADVDSLCFCPKCRDSLLRWQDLRKSRDPFSRQQPFSAVPKTELIHGTLVCEKCDFTWSKDMPKD